MVMRVLHEKLRLSLVAVGLILLQACLAAGCVTHGHRKLSITFLGQTIIFEDEAYKNDEGRETYRVGFDEDSSVVDLLFGWLRPAPTATEGKEANSELDVDPVPKPLIGGDIPESEDNANEATDETDITD